MVRPPHSVEPFVRKTLSRGRWDVRAILGVAAVGAVLGLAATADAQQTSQFFRSGRPSMAFGAAGPIVNKPIDTGLNSGAFNTNNGFLGGLFRNLSLTSWPPKVASSPYPAPSAFPGANHPNKLQPVAPIIP